MYRLEAVQICAKRIRQNKRIKSIVFRTSYAMAIPEAVQLLGVNREHRITSLRETLDYSSSGNLDRNSHSICWLLSLLRNPVHELSDSDTAMWHSLFRDLLSAGIHKADLMLFGRPINTD